MMFRSLRTPVVEERDPSGSVAFLSSQLSLTAVPERKVRLCNQPSIDSDPGREFVSGWTSRHHRDER